MAQRTQRRKTKMSLREVGTIVFLLVAIIWFVFLVRNIYQKEKIARITVGDTRAELAALDARKATLSNTVHDLGTERGQEASLRETYGVARPGEDVIIVVPTEKKAAPVEPTFWEKVKAFFSF